MRKVSLNICQGICVTLYMNFDQFLRHMDEGGGIGWGIAVERCRVWSPAWSKESGIVIRENFLLIWNDWQESNDIQNGVKTLNRNHQTWICNSYDHAGYFFLVVAMVCKAATSRQFWSSCKSINSFTKVGGDTSLNRTTESLNHKALEARDTRLT